jgi:hypothetical protein
MQGWSHHIPVQPATPTGNLTNWPYVIPASLFPPHFWAGVKADLSDVAVSLADNTRLPCVVVHPNQPGSHANIYTKASPLSAGAPLLKVHYGNPDASTVAANHAFGQHAVFNADCRMFTPDGLGNDLTSFLNHLTPFGSPSVADVAGPIPGSFGTSLNGSSQYGTSPTSVPTAVPVSILASFKAGNTTSNHVVAGIFDTADASVDSMHLNWDGSITDRIRATVTSADAASVSDSASSFTTASYFRGGAVFTTTTNRRSFLNGVIGSASGSFRQAAGLDLISVGALQTNSASLFALGDVSAVSIWTAALSQEFMSYDAAMYGNPVTFYTIGEPTPNIPAGAAKGGLSLSMGLRLG